MRRRMKAVSARTLLAAAPAGASDHGHRRVAATATPTPTATPSLPSKLTRDLFMSAGSEKFSVRWRKSRDAGVSRYELQYQTKPENGGSWPSAWTAIGETIAAEAGVTIYQYEHEGLDSDLRYRYQVRAVNAAGAGPWSAAFWPQGAVAGGDDAHGAGGRGGRDRAGVDVGGEQCAQLDLPEAGAGGGLEPPMGVDYRQRRDTKSHTFSGLTEGALVHLQGAGDERVGRQSALHR